MAKKIDHTMVLHGDSREDPYYWLRDDTRSDPEILAYLEAENDYTESVLAHTKPLQDTLFKEITRRLSDADSTVPVKNGDWYYHQEYLPGKEYPVYFRRGLEAESPEILLDVNKLAVGHEYYRVGNWSVSPNGRYLAYAEDTVSRRLYNIRIKDLKTGEVLSDHIPGVSTSIAWAADSKHLFYVSKDPQTLLAYQVYRHELGKPADADFLVYEEQDEAFYTQVYATRSDEFIVISSQSTDSSEIHLIRSQSPTESPRVFLPREPGLEYRIRHVGDDFYVITNWQAPDFRIMRVNETLIGDKRHWQDVIPARENILVQDLEVFENFLVVDERVGGLSQLRVISKTDNTSHIIDFPDPAYTASLHSNPEPESQSVRYEYTSLTQPDSIYEFNMTTRQTRLLKQDELQGGYDQTAYQSERVMIEARDGEFVPVSMVYRKDKFSKGKNPLYLYAYGSYGYATDPTFNSKVLSLLDRGFVYGLVHVRGGEDKGRQWYENGKLLHKWNTFNDFIDATQSLVEQGYGDPKKVIAMGGSAGGLLMGVLANEAPEDYLAIIAHVPFVDVVTTMLDDTIPLTSGEYSEWGNPNDKTFYEYMLSYSPYDQVKEQAYPNLFVTTGLHDSQVQYFEPTKWVAKLRAMKQDDNLLLMDVNMDGGHSGASGRYERYRDDALEYAFILDLLKGRSS